MRSRHRGLNFRGDDLPGAGGNMKKRNFPRYFIHFLLKTARVLSMIRRFFQRSSFSRASIMKFIRLVAFVFFAYFVTVSLADNFVRAADLIIQSGDTQTLSDPVLLTTEKYGNEGTLRILSGGSLLLGDGVVNNPPLPEGVIGLDLGKVVSDGFIDALQTIRFREESQLGGIVTSLHRIIFDGSVIVNGNISAEMIVFNQGSDSTKYSSIDLTHGDSGLNVGHLIINGKVDVTLRPDQPLEIVSLELGQIGAILETSEDVVVSGSFFAAPGSGLASKLDAAGKGHGNIRLEGGKEVEGIDGINNVLAGTIKAGTLTVQNRSYIVDLFNVQGNLVFGADSHTEAEAALIVNGSLSLQTGATLKLGSDEAGFLPFGSYIYNGIFYEGLDLADGSLLTSTADNGPVFLAILDDSVIRAGATLAARDVFFSGTDEYGDASRRQITNAGTIQSDLLYLRSVDLRLVDGGTIDVKDLMLFDGAVLDLTGNNNILNGGLTFSGDDKRLYIGADSHLVARTLELVGGSIENRNMEGGIYVSNLLRIGEGSTLFGSGTIHADTEFTKGGKLSLGLYGTDFGSKDVIFQTGSTIEMSIIPERYGTLVTSGKVLTEDGVFLGIVDGSNFEGRTQYFCVASGGLGSEFSTDLRLVDSLFFKLSQVIPIGVGEADPTLDNTLWVEIVKVADLVDYAGSDNQRNFAAMIDRLMETGGANNAQKRVFDALMRIGSDAEYRQALNDLTGNIRANSLVVALSSPWRAPLERAGMERLSLYVPRRTASRAEAATEFLGQATSPLQCNLWFDSHYTHLNLRSDGNASGGLGNRFGINLGIEWTPTYETLFGWTFGYANNGFTQDNGHLVINDYQFGLYGGANMFKRNFQVRGYVGYGHLDFTHDRRVSLPDAYHTVHGTTPGDSVSASLMLIRPVDLSDQFLFKPTFGVDFERITQKGFSEYGDPGIRLSYDGAEFQRLMLRAGASGERLFRRGSLWGRIFYGVKVAGDTTALSHIRLVGTTGPSAETRSVNIGNSAFDVGFGGKHSLNAAKSLWLFADYNGNFAKRSDSHTGSLGFLWKR